MKKIMLISSFVIFIILFIILVPPFVSLWPVKWPDAAQATLAAAITAGFVSILVAYLKFIFDQISSKTAYNQKISGKMLSRVHTYAEKYYIPLGSYARYSALLLTDILSKERASEQEKQLALFLIAKYFHYRFRLSIKGGGMIFLRSFDSEMYLDMLHTRARQNLELSTVQVGSLQKSLALEDIFLDFPQKILDDINNLKEIYETFEKWLEKNDDVKKTIAYFHCYYELMFHELNSIYEPWYQRKAPQISNKSKNVLHSLKKLKKLEEKKDKGKILKNEYEEKTEEEENNLNNSISGFFKD